MAHEIFVKDTITGQCGFATPICPTIITQGTGPVTVTDNSTPGNPSYEISVTPHTVDINLDNFAFNPATRILTIVETDGTSHSVDLATLVDPETTTNITTPGGGIIRYTNEEGTVQDVNLCTTLAEFPAVGLLQCV